MLQMFTTKAVAGVTIGRSKEPRQKQNGGQATFWKFDLL
jgi:hypothetical protein